MSLVQEVQISIVFDVKKCIYDGEVKHDSVSINHTYLCFCQVYRMILLALVIMRRSLGGCKYRYGISDTPARLCLFSKIIHLSYYYTCDGFFQLASAYERHSVLKVDVKLLLSTPAAAKD